MTVDADRAELAKVDAAIDQILASGQEARLGNAELVQARLETLYKRKDLLQTRIDRAGRGGIRIQYGTPV